MKDWDNGSDLTAQRFLAYTAMVNINNYLYGIYFSLIDSGTIGGLVSGNIVTVRLVATIGKTKSLLLGMEGLLYESITECYLGSNHGDYHSVSVVSFCCDFFLTPYSLLGLGSALLGSLVSLWHLSSSASSLEGDFQI